MIELADFLLKNMQQKEITHSSLIEFSVENFGCFRDKVTFSMETRKDGKNSFSIKKTGETLLKTGIIYGPNASGKSTLINAMEFMSLKIRKSMDEEHPEKIRINPFLLQEGFQENPSYFEITFLLGSDVFRYSFSVDKNHIILSEQLVSIGRTTEFDLFVRKKQNFIVDEKFTKNSLIHKEATRENALYLSATSQLNISLAKKITSFFRFGLEFFNSSSTRHFTGLTAEKSNKDIEFRIKVEKLLEKFDFCFDGFSTSEKLIQIPDDIKEIFERDGKKIPSKLKTVNFHHKVYNNTDEEIDEVDINIKNQSAGTQKLFQELGPILLALESGSILIVDELDTNFHPKILKAIVDLFHDEETNPYNAQLIFTTHETSLLSYAKDEIDRDAFWFTQRDKYGRAELFSLSEFKERKDSANIDKKYLDGRYGAVPFIAYNL